MKKVLSMLLVIAMMFSLTVSAMAESPVNRDGSSLYAESSEVIEGELYDQLLAFYGAEDYSSLVSSTVIKTVKAPSWYTTVIDDVVIDEESFALVLDDTPLTAGSGEIVYVEPGEHTVSISFYYFADYHFRGVLTGSTKEGGVYENAYNGKAKGFTFSVLAPTFINLEKSSVSYTYGTEGAEQLILDTVVPTVALSDGTPVDDAVVAIAEDVSDLNAGSHTVTLLYDGADYGDYTGLQPATAEITVNVSKAAASIIVDSSLIVYNGEEQMPNIVVTPEGLPYTAFTVGLQGDAVGFASIYMTEGNALYNALLFLRNSGDTLARLAAFLGYDISDFVFGSDGLSLAQLRQVISGLNDIAGLLSYAGIKLDETQTGAILTALDGIGDFMERFNINANFYIGNMPKNSGTYVTYAVINETNYNIAMDFAVIEIIPDFNVSMEWNQSVSGYAFYPDNVYDFDFTSFVTNDGETPLDTQINYLITGFGSDGHYFSTTSLDNLPTLPGTYTETASCAVNYASMAVRFFTVNKYATSVKFVDESGELVDAVSIDAEYDGDPKGFEAVLVDENGDLIDAELTYSYTGTTKLGTKYSSSEAPFDSGDYKLKVSFRGDEYYAASSNNSPP